MFQDEYFRTANCSLLLSVENSCKICDKENIKFKTKVNFKKALAKPVYLNAPVNLHHKEKQKMAPNLTQDNSFSLKFAFIPNLIARNNISISESLEMISHQLFMLQVMCFTTSIKIKVLVELTAKQNLPFRQSHSC